MVLNLKQIEQTCKVVYFCFLAHSLFDKCNFFSVFVGSKVLSFKLTKIILNIIY